MTPLASAITIIAAALLAAAVLTWATRQRRIRKIKCSECGGIFPFRTRITINGFDFCRRHGRVYQEVLHLGPYERRYHKETERLYK